MNVDVSRARHALRAALKGCGRMGEPAPPGNPEDGGAAAQCGLLRRTPAGGREGPVPGWRWCITWDRAKGVWCDSLIRCLLGTEVLARGEGTHGD